MRGFQKEVLWIFSNLLGLDDPNVCQRIAENKGLIDEVVNLVSTGRAET